MPSIDRHDPVSLSTFQGILLMGSLRLNTGKYLTNEHCATNKRSVRTTVTDEGPNTCPSSTARSSFLWPCGEMLSRNNRLRVTDNSMHPGQHILSPHRHGVGTRCACSFVHPIPNLMTTNVAPECCFFFFSFFLLGCWTPGLTNRNRFSHVSSAWRTERILRAKSAYQGRCGPAPAE
jgi:hypothetical protein